MIKKIRDRQVKMFETSVEDLVKKDHPYRKLLSIINFSKFCKPLKSLLVEGRGCPGYNIESGFTALVLQWMEDLSDRELERFLQENNAAKLFCGFSLLEKTPDHSYFCVLRKKIGTEKLAKMFNKLGDSLREKGLVSNVFTFIDASKMISKMALWDERDKALKIGVEKFNNEVVKKFDSDNQARFGCKGKSKFWFGYKRHVAACMKKGFITKVAITPANITDAKGLKHVCPEGGLIYADKAYCDKPAQDSIKKKNCISKAILKNHMKDKDFKRDAKIAKLRMPYEHIFSKMDKKVRYKGVAKTQFQGFMQAMVFNFKKLISIDSIPVFT